MRKSLIGLIIAGGLVFGAKALAKDSEKKYFIIRDSTSERGYIDPFELPFKSYDELSDEDKKVADEFEEKNYRSPADAPGLKMLAPYFGKSERGANRFSKSFWRGYEKSLRRMGRR